MCLIDTMTPIYREDYLDLVTTIEHTAAQVEKKLRWRITGPSWCRAGFLLPATDLQLFDSCCQKKKYGLVPLHCAWLYMPGTSFARCSRPRLDKPLKYLSRRRAALTAQPAAVTSMTAARQLLVTSPFCACTYVFTCAQTTVTSNLNAD